MQGTISTPTSAGDDVFLQMICIEARLRELTPAFHLSNFIKGHATGEKQPEPLIAAPAIAQSRRYAFIVVAQRVVPLRLLL